MMSYLMSVKKTRLTFLRSAPFILIGIVAEVEELFVVVGIAATFTQRLGLLAKDTAHLKGHK